MNGGKLNWWQTRWFVAAMALLGILIVAGWAAILALELGNGTFRIESRTEASMLWESDTTRPWFYTVGAGYEQMLGKNVSARIEYNYSDYGNDTLPGPGGPSTINYHRHAVMTGVNFRF